MTFHGISRDVSQYPRASADKRGVTFFGTWLEKRKIIYSLHALLKIALIIKVSLFYRLYLIRENKMEMKTHFHILFLYINQNTVPDPNCHYWIYFKCQNSSFVSQRHIPVSILIAQPINIFELLLNKCLLFY